MATRIGQVEALYRYPVKSMAGEAVGQVQLGWHGLHGDRRLAFRRLDDRGGFPWLTATKLPELLRFAPVRRGADATGELPTHVRTPEGDELALFGDELAADVGARHGSPLEMTHLDRGIFDEASVSAITSGTVAEVARLVGQEPDVRRFRPNILIATESGEPFAEDLWVGGVLTFGEGGETAAMALINRDERCAMVNYDPDSARSLPDVFKTIVRERDNKAGVYGTVIRRGSVAVGQPLFFTPGGASG
jgi:uncharacterized protein YcbX